MSAHQYFCQRCGYEREGLLDHDHGIGGYSWACPKCKSHDIGSREVIPCPQAEVDDEIRKERGDARSVIVESKGTTARFVRCEHDGQAAPMTVSDLRDALDRARVAYGHDPCWVILDGEGPAYSMFFELGASEPFVIISAKKSG